MASETGEVNAEQDADGQEETSPLVVHLDALMLDLRARVPAALTEWQADAIHQSRVATRRMKAALDLMRGVLSRRPRRTLGRIMRDLRRRLGPLRDADVMIEHLREIAETSPNQARAAAWLSNRLAAKRERLRKASSKLATPGAVVGKLRAWEPVRDEVQAGREAVDSLLAESLHLQLDVFAEQADRLIGGTDGGPVRQDPHELRISGKALRYTLELAVVQEHDLPSELTKTFKKMQDALGLWHDYVVLADRAMHDARSEALAHHQPELMNDVLEVLRELLGEATRQLDKFKRLWTEEGDAVAKAIRASYPLTRPLAAAAAAAAVSESRTGPGPSGSERSEGPAGTAPTDPSDA